MLASASTTLKTGVGIGLWADKTNAKQRSVDWQFKIDDARTKLERLYPKVSDLRQSRRLEIGEPLKAVVL